MTSWRKWLSLSVSAFGTFLLATIPVLATEEPEPAPVDTTAGAIFRWLNFLIIVGGLVYLIKKYGGTFFGANAKAVTASIAEAQAAKAAADRELSEVSAKISHVDQEVESLHQSAQRDVTAEAERLRASGLAEVEKIKAAARAELAASERAAQQQLREVAAAMAVERAGEVIISKMTQEVRAKLFQSFLGALERSSN